MRTQIDCGQCGWPLDFDSDQAGQMVPCPHCASSTLVLALEDTRPPEAEVLPFHCRACGFDLMVSDVHDGKMVACPECNVKSLVGAAAPAWRPEESPTTPSVEPALVLFTCPRCRAQLSVPDTYVGRTIPCPECDSMSSVGAVTGHASQIELAPEEGRRAEVVSFACPGCGARLTIPDSYLGKTLTCPECEKRFEVTAANTDRGAAGLPKQPDEVPPEALAESEPGLLPPMLRLSPDCLPNEAITRTPELPDRQAQPTIPTAAPGASPASGDPTYEVSDFGKRCPHCHKDMTPLAIVCVACGYDIARGKVPEARHTYFEQTWHMGLSLPVRLGLWLLPPLLCLPAILLNWKLTLALMLAAYVLLGLLCGTYFKITLIRDERGRVRLVKRWFVYFIPAGKTVVDTRRYDRLLLDCSRDLTIVSTLFLVSLLAAGVVPGLLWWVLLMMKETYTLILAGDGSPESPAIYQGWSQTRMDDVAQTLRQLVVLDFGRR